MILIIWQKMVQFCCDCFRELDFFFREKGNDSQQSLEDNVRYIHFHSRKRKDLLGVYGENAAFLFVESIRYFPFCVERLPKFFSKSLLDKNQSKKGFLSKILRFRRYLILERNIRLQSSEFDIVAFDKQKKCIVFFEVKTRRTLHFGQPYQAVDERRQKKMIKGAREYLSYKNYQNLKVRFDIISILWQNENDLPQIEHLENAFDPLYISDLVPKI